MSDGNHHYVFVHAGDRSWLGLMFVLCDAHAKTQKVPPGAALSKQGATDKACEECVMKSNQRRVRKHKSSEGFK